MVKKILGFDLDREVQYAWAAGLFDGEGSVCYSKEADRPNPRIHLTISMTCEDTTMKFCDVVGVGNIRKLKYYENHPKYKEQWRWSTESSLKVADVLLKLGPYFVTKRYIINRALKFWHENIDTTISGKWRLMVVKAREVMPYAI